MMLNEVTNMTNKTKYKIAVLGGDGRQAQIASRLAKMGHRVSCFSVDGKLIRISGCEICMGVDKAMSGADFAILPLPLSKDGIHLNSLSQKIELSEIVTLAKKNGTRLFGGVVPSEFRRVCRELDVDVTDYYASESLQIKNALPSAEGSLMIAMEHTDITVSGMRALVCGYGRIGKILADILRKLDAKVTVAARRDEVLCEIEMSGFESVKIDGGDALSKAAECDVIFNTVPYVIFTERVMKNIRSSPLYIEIASSPGGIDSSSARDSGIDIIYAPSLPGRYSPRSAGDYVLETISEILSERGIDL